MPDEGVTHKENTSGCAVVPYATTHVCCVDVRLVSLIHAVTVKLDVGKPVNGVTVSHTIRHHKNRDAKSISRFSIGDALQTEHNLSQ
jgi:hypothetical protein